MFAATDLSAREVKRDVRAFQAPNLWESLLQVGTSLGGFVAVSGLMYVLARESYWLALALAPIAAGFLVRTFIVQHDCGHGSFFRSSRANDLLGYVCSLATFAPYPAWRRQHSAHHGAWNDLDRRSEVDIYANCLTVREYLALGPWQRRLCRWSRGPFVANVLLPPLLFVVLYRLPIDLKDTWRMERRSVHLTTLALIVVYGLLAAALGPAEVAAIQLQVLAIAAIVGVWLFSVQHRAEEIVWARHADWDATTASLQGATHLRLPRILRWFTGNIGLHHIHHLNPRVPNYRLQDCHEAVAACRTAPELTIAAAFGSMKYTLWDEAAGRMTTFRAAEASRAG